MGKAPEHLGPGEGRRQGIQTAAQDQAARFGFVGPHAQEKIIGAVEAPAAAFADNTAHGIGGQPFDRHQAAAHGTVGALPADPAFMHIRGQDADPQAPGFGDIGEGAVKSPLVADDGGHEFGRKMGFEIGGLERHPGIGGAVGFAKGVAGKAHHHGPDCLDLFLGHAPLHGAGDELSADSPSTGESCSFLDMILRRPSASAS